MTEGGGRGGAFCSWKLHKLTLRDRADSRGWQALVARWVGDTRALSDAERKASGKGRARMAVSEGGLPETDTRPCRAPHLSKAIEAGLPDPDPKIPAPGWSAASMPAPGWAGRSKGRPALPRLTAKGPGRLGPDLGSFCPDSSTPRRLAGPASAPPSPGRWEPGPSQTPGTHCQPPGTPASPCPTTAVRAERGHMARWTGQLSLSAHPHPIQAGASTCPVDAHPGSLPGTLAQASGPHSPEPQRASPGGWWSLLPPPHPHIHWTIRPSTDANED